MKKIVFKKGDETRAKFENLRDENILNDSIFSDIYDSAFSLIAEISKQDNSEKSKQYDSEKYKQYDSEKSEHNRERNNIIAFIGERGSGKTSCLKSVYNSLNKQNGNVNSLPTKIRNIQVSFNNQLPIIDPSYLDEQSNIIEIVIAHMFQSFKEAVNNSKYSFEGDNLEKKRELVKKFQEVKDALDCTNPKKYNYASNDSIEELSKLASGSNLRKKMAELVNGYLEYFKSNDDKGPQMLVIAIDDLDVQTNHTYQMVEQIRKYLIIENVVILLGVKLIQLSDLIKKKYVEDFKDKNNGLVLNDQIDDMVARYLIKLLPLSHRLNLPSYNEIPDIELEIVLTDKSENGKNNNYKYINLQENVLSLIYIKTGLTFYNTLEQENMIVPHNLRELLNFIALLSNMEDNDENKDKNRNVFRQYFIESWCLDRLTPKQHIFIKELNECDAINFNKFIIDYVCTEYNSYFKNGIINIDNSIIDINNRCYNVSIADVNYILDTLSNINNTTTKRFVFAIKTTYSMVLYNKFNEIDNNENIKKHADLLYKYQTGWDVSYKSINKLNHISDYEKMLGGNIINIPINDDNKSRYTGVIEAAKMKEYYNSGSIQKFNIFELFLLTTTFYNSHKDARKLKHCYYNSFPVEEYPDNGMVVFNFTSILYNVVRYRILYGKYLYVKEKIDSMQDEIQKLNTQIAQKEIYNIGTFNTRNELNYYLKLKKDKEKIQSKIDACKKIELYKFFDNIENKKDESIIYSIIGPDNGRFNLLVSSITNIEILDLLSDYMGRLEKNRTISSPIEDVKSFFKKLSNFRYYRYNKKNNDNDTHCYVEKELNILGINEMISELDINLYNDILNSYKQPL